MRIKDLFSDKPCNTGRQPELDLAKTVLIIALAFVHCTIECTPEDGLTSGLPYFLDSVIGGPLGAPVLMFAMGFGMVYTRHGGAADFFRRGIKLGIVGYVLNLCRYTIPYLVGYAISGDSEQFLSDIIYKSLENDILIFASLSFLLMSLFLRLNFRPWLMLIIAYAMTICATLLNGADLNNIPANIFIGYFIGTEDAEGLVRSYFPLFNWFVVPVFGYFFAYYFRLVKEKGKFYTIFSSPAAVITVIYLWTGIPAGRGVFGEGQLCYYHITIADVTCAMVGVVALLGLYYVIVKYLPNPIMAFITETSVNINSIYCIHWIFVVWITNVMLYIATGSQVLPLWITMILAAGIAAVSFTIAHYYKEFKHSRRKSNEK